MVLDQHKKHSPAAAAALEVLLLLSCLLGGADALLLTSFLGPIQILPVAVGPTKRGQRCSGRTGRDVLLP